MLKASLKDYYRLAKPGIIYGNVFTTVAAFLFASHWHFGSVLFPATVAGIALVIASACVFNNYLDRDIDGRMARTKNRALVTGVISVRSALIYGTVLGFLGLILLSVYVNLLTAGVALFGFLMYVIVYGIAKRRSEWGAVVGSIPGAVPIVVGYTAVTGQLDITALILFTVLAIWQIPHFYAIAIYRFDEYAAAGIPTLAAKRGIRTTKIYILVSILAYTGAVSLLTVAGRAGYAYLASALLFGCMWLGISIEGFKAKDDAKWAKKTFLFSLIVLITFSLSIAFLALI